MSKVRWLISVPFRALGYALVIAALLAGFADLYASVEATVLVRTPLGQWLRDLSPELLATAQPAVQRYLHPVLWDPVIQTFLRLPGWLALGLLAALTLLIAQLIYRAR